MLALAPHVGDPRPRRSASAALHGADAEVKGAHNPRQAVVSEDAAETTVFHSGEQRERSLHRHCFC